MAKRVYQLISLCTLYALLSGVDLFAVILLIINAGSVLQHPLGFALDALSLHIRHITIRIVVEVETLVD